MNRKLRALLSVTNKDGIVALAAALVSTGWWEVVSTGGTAKLIRGKNVPCVLVEDVTGFPEMLDGRLKTLHPKIHGGILANREKPEHMADLAAHGIGPIDLVVVNLYNFATNPSIEEIDIGGPTLLRGAAKNAATVPVLVDPADYDAVLAQLSVGLEVSELTREYLARKVFRHTALYDTAIADWMDAQSAIGNHFLRPVVSPH